MREIKKGDVTCLHKDGTIFMKTKKSLFYLDKCRVCGIDIVVGVDQDRICSECVEKEEKRLKDIDDKNSKIKFLEEENKQKVKYNRCGEREREAEKKKYFAVCRWCGKEFERKKYEQKFCSEECKEKQHNLYTNGEIRKCEICGKSYIAKVKQQKFCSSTCKQRSHVLAEGEKYVPSLKTAKCKFCGKKFTPRNRVNCFCSHSCANRYYAQKQREDRLKRREKLRES